MTMQAQALKIVVIDDDPTGSQTVHGCPLLLRWDHDTLLAGLRDPSPLLFLLANTRALAPPEASERVRRICRALRPALAEAGLAQWVVVSRGDSTLRGHFPLETEVISQELGPFDATLLVPAFLEGGRTTVGGVHLLQGRPVHESPFARDPRFPYGTSDLPRWIEAKSGGRLPAEQVERIALEELDPAGVEALERRLRTLAGNRHVVVDAERPEQLRVLGQVVRALMAPAGGAPPRRLLFQSAASLLSGLADLPPQPLDPARLAGLRRGSQPGAVLVGSHVPLTDRQLQALLAEPGCVGVELPVESAMAAFLAAADTTALEREWIERLGELHRSGHTPVLFTSRGWRGTGDAALDHRFGLFLARLMARIAHGLPDDLSYLISKGGTTSQTLLAEGLGLAAVRLEGQLLPGLSLLRLPADHPRFPELPLLTFPGNLGAAGTLRRAWQWMDPHTPDPGGDPL